MFLTSFLKKISSSENKPQPTKVDNVISEDAVPISSVNLPSWKDGTVWSTPLGSQHDVISQCQEIKEIITDLLRMVKDPEKPNTLADLQVITDESVQVQPFEGDGYLVRIDFNPTVPHCSLASLIGLCIRGKIQKNVLERIKLDIVIAKGKHSTEEEINKQINDKERVAAALENPNLKELVDSCIREEE
ncbi:hypothetical protein GHT06_022829 [Daphnia sinensis]|uniref:MIP18 family-like domain-containing protein n=1 Tax=Daphnia sinensis TaxID=1820382 RepID=A0AAD5PP12_9CRUS|nr:hypothetical protein GHT06_022829 [Daphnia sinensis]